MTKKVTTNGSHISNGLEATKCWGNQLTQQFKSGDIAWIRIRNCSWWPGQVVDEESVSFKPNKKANDRVLVRMYGTYEYLYVDPVKCSAEFENILKQENISIRVAFQKALEEDRVRSGGKSKRKVSESRENATIDAPKGKKQKQDKMEIMERGDSPPPPGASSGKAEVVRALEKERDKPRVKATRERKAKQDEATKPKVTKRTRDGASKDKSAELGGAGKPNVKEKVSNGASKIKETRQDALEKPKHKDVKEQMTGKVTGKPRVTVKALNGASKIKDTKQDALKKPEPKDVKKHITEKVKDEASKDKISKQGGVGKSKLTEKTKNGASKGKNMKQNNSIQTKGEDPKEQSKTKSPISIGGIPEGTTADLSARRMRVMQSLGLIAPLGSPFRRNSFVIASSLQ